MGDDVNFAAMPGVQPLIVTFYDLLALLGPLHQGNQADVARLHDIWLEGAPTPDTRILNPRNYDERKRQPGNREKRIVFPPLLARWVMDVSKRRGFPYTERQVYNMLAGRADYGFDQARND